MSTQISKRSEKNTDVAIFVTVVFCLSTIATALAIEPINKTSDGVAIKGYSPVSHFTDGKPVKGSKAFEYVRMGARWHFSGTAHRALFISAISFDDGPKPTGLRYCMNSAVLQFVATPK